MTREAVRLSPAEVESLNQARSGQALVATVERIATHYRDIGLAESERLRQRIHTIADDVQRRYAPYMSRCAKFDTWSAWARDHFALQGDLTWTHGSEANRLLILALMEDRDKALQRVADLEQQVEDARKGETREQRLMRYQEALEWLCEDDNARWMDWHEPELMRRLRRVLFGARA